MPFWMIRDSLVNRGYWNEADENGGEGGGSAGGASDGAEGDAGGAEAGGQGDGEGGSDGSGDKAGGEGNGEGEQPKSKEKPKPSDKEAELLKEVMKKKDRVKELESQLKQFEDIDPDQVRQLLQEKRDAEVKELERKGDYDRLKERLINEHKTERDKLEQKMTDLQAQLGSKDSVINDLTVGSAFTSSTFISEDMTLTPSKARVVYGDHFEVVDGKVVAYDKPKSAKERTPLVDANGNNLPFEAAIKAIVEADPEKDALLKAKGKQGAGSGTLPGAKPPKQERQLKGAEKIAQGLSRQKLA